MSNSTEGAKKASVAVVKENSIITASAVKELLEQGKDRAEIAAHFGKSVAEMKRTVWSDPSMKNLKKKAASTITFINDTVEAGALAEAPVAESVVEAVEEVAQEEVAQEEVAQVPAADTGANWG